MRGFKGLLRMHEQNKTIIKVFIDSLNHTNDFKVGIIRGIRKDHFLLDTYCSQSLKATGKVSVINTHRVVKIEEFELPGCPPSKGNGPKISIETPCPINVTFLDTKMQLKLPCIQIQAKGRGHQSDIQSKLSDILEGLGVNNCIYKPS